MVLWEITLGTAYFLGLKRTYRLALKIQRRLISPKHPRIRQFLHRRTRAIFDAALKVHKNIQERDIEVGRNIGNWILRWLDRMKPSAQIRGEKPLSCGTTKTSSTIRPTDSSHQKTTTGGSLPSNGRSRDRESDNRHLFTSTRDTWRQSFPSISVTMQPTKQAGTDTQFRHLFTGGTQARDFGPGRFGSEPVVRNDIRQWLLQN